MDSADLKKSEEDYTQKQWIVLHDDLVIGMYDNKYKAIHALEGYRLSHSLDINSNLIMRQII